MSSRQWAVLGFKLTGLWLIASALVTVAGVPYFWSSTFDEVRGLTVLWAVLPALVAIGLGVPIFFSADWFAGRLFSHETSTERQAAMAPEQTFGLALAIMGAFLLCEAIPGLVNAAALVFFGYRATSGVLGVNQGAREVLWDAGVKAGLASTVTQLLLGVALLLGPGRLSAMFGRIRREFQSDLTEGEEAAAEARRSADDRGDVV